MNQNTRYVLPKLLLAVTMAALIVFGVVASALRGEYVIPIFVVVVAGLIAASIFQQSRKQAELFHAPSPEPIVSFYKKQMAKQKDGAQMSAFLCGLAFTYYGKFDEARGELTSVSWIGLPPMYEGYRSQVLMLLAVFQEHDYEKAHALALEIQDLCQVPKSLPGAATGGRSLQAFVDCCEILRGRPSQELVDRLEASFDKLQSLTSLLPAWTLARHFAAADPAKSDQYQQHIKKFAPHCKPLHMDVQ